MPNGEQYIGQQQKLHTPAMSKAGKNGARPNSNCQVGSEGLPYTCLTVHLDFKDVEWWSLQHMATHGTVGN